MSVQLQIGGIAVSRCSQGATVSLGMNAVTNLSNRKENEAIYYVGDGIALIPTTNLLNFDMDAEDSSSAMFENIAIGPL